MKTCKKVADVVCCIALLILLGQYVFWAVSFVGQYESTMDPLPLILWRRFLDGPALTLAVWGLLQGAFWASSITGKGLFWWGTLLLGGLFALWHGWEAATYTTPALPVSADPHQIIAALGGVALTVWSLLCTVLCLLLLQKKK